MSEDPFPHPKSPPRFLKANSEAEDSLFEALLTLKTKDEVRRFFYDVCTPKEIADLSDRWWVARLLAEGKPSYRDIHALTGVSVTTVGRVARFLQQEQYQGYQIALQRMKR
jgi:TrpR-related protein YerC/YecD